MMLSYTSVGDGLDNLMMKSFWSSMRIGLLNPQSGKTSAKPAFFKHIGIPNNRRRPYSAIGYRTSTEHQPLQNPVPS
jgi:putative transposase